MADEDSNGVVEEKGSDGDDCDVKEEKGSDGDVNGVQEEKWPSLNDKIVRQIEVKSLWTEA